MTDTLISASDQPVVQKPSSQDIFDKIGKLTAEKLTDEKAVVEGVRPEDLLLPSDLEQIERIRGEFAQARDAGAIGGTEPIEESLKGSANRIAEQQERERLLMMEATGTAARLAVESNLDNKTNLYTARAIADVAGTKILEFWSGARTNLRNVKIRLSDRLLFHFGNESLTMAGFDTRIGTETDGQIALSKTLADGNNDLYKPFPDDPSFESDSSINKYFPEGSPQRTTLELLRERVKIIPARVNANGGDEFIQLIDLPDKGTRAAERAAVGLIEGVTTSTSLVPEIEVVDAQRPRTLSSEDIAARIGEENIHNEKDSYWRDFYNASNQLRFSHEGMDNPNIITPREAQYYNAFAVSLRHNLWENASFREHFRDPTIESRMDDAVAYLDNGELPSLDDAMVAFCYGTDTYGNRFLDDSREATYGFLDKEGGLNEEKVSAYAESLAKKIKASATEVEITDPTKMTALVQRTIAIDISTQFINLLNIRVNEISKKQKKSDLAIKAFTATDPQAAFTVASTEASNRKFLSGFSDDERFTILKQVHDHYQQKLDRPDSELNDDQLKMKRQMEQLKQRHLIIT